MSDSEELLGAISLARPPRHMKTPRFPFTPLPYASHLCLHSFVIVSFHLAQEQIRSSVTTEIIRRAKDMESKRKQFQMRNRNRSGFFLVGQ